MDSLRARCFRVWGRGTALPVRCTYGMACVIRKFEHEREAGPRTLATRRVCRAGGTGLPCRTVTRDRAYAFGAWVHPARQLNRLARRKVRPPRREHRALGIMRGEFIMAPVPSVLGLATCLAEVHCLFFSFDLDHEHVAAGIAWPVRMNRIPMGIFRIWSHCRSM